MPSNPAPVTPGDGNGSTPPPNDAGDDSSSLLGSAADAGTGGQGADGAAAAADGGIDGSGDGNEAQAEVPETYQLKYEVKGEGDEMVAGDLDPTLVEKATPILKDLKLTNDQANKLVGMVPEIQQRTLQALNDDFTATRAAWAKQTKEDSEIGGRNMAETLSLAGRALDKFGAPSVKDAQGNETNEFRALLNDSGLGDHPVMLKMFREIGKLVGEDNGLIRSDSNPQSKKSREEILYPDDVPNANQGV